MATKKIDFRKNPQDQIFKLHISLPETKPLVWRRVMVPGTFTLEALHSIIQLAMGWQMSHLYEFRIGKDQYRDPDEFDDDHPKLPATSIAAALREHKSFTYTYDFGDDWRHEIAVEEVLARDDRANYPVCTGGENACPPEDCHGVSGYADLKATIADPKSREYAETWQWLGGHFDPTSFDPNRINRDMLWMIDWSKDPNDQGLYLPFSSEDDED